MDKFQMVQSKFMGESYLRVPKNESQVNINQKGNEYGEIIDEILSKSIRNSYIGTISGDKRKKMFEEHKWNRKEELQPIEQIVEQKKRIDFSIIRPAQSEIKIRSDEFDYLDLISFKDRAQNNHKPRQTCMSCKENQEEAVRYKCVLQNQSVFEMFGKDKEGKYQELLLSLNFDTVNVFIQYDKMHFNKEMKLQFGMYQMILQHDKKEIIDFWYKKLEQMKNQSKSTHYALTVLENTEEFYKQRYMTENYFTNNCKTGDVILFQDEHFFAKAQRFVTNSDFDHVGMVVRDLQYGILIFQSNGGAGVSLTPWKSVVKYGWYRTIPKISWRKLEGIERDSEFNEKMQKFIMENLNKSYHISFEKLFSRTSTLRNPDETDVEKGYFCSQLVAYAYKQMGFLTRDTSDKNYLASNNFYPKDFSQKANRQLQKGYLSPEYQLYFDPQLLTQNYKGLYFDN